jgi:hypothetical protein
VRVLSISRWALVGCYQAAQRLLHLGLRVCMRLRLLSCGRLLRLALGRLFLHLALSPMA